MTSTNHVIPNEAATEARRAIEREFPYDENNEYIVRLVLEAAAPHLMAAAWEEGFDKGFYDPKAGSYWDASESTATNPYRKAGA
jgi:hypothetical protein